MATLDALARIWLTHNRPHYQIETVEIGGRTMAVQEEVTLGLPFGSLLHFKKIGTDHLAYQPPVLLPAPLSGHYATLLRETVRTLLQDHDVYITDWHNARDIGLWHGGRGLDACLAAPCPAPLPVLHQGLAGVAIETTKGQAWLQQLGAISPWPDHLTEHVLPPGIPVQHTA